MILIALAKAAEAAKTPERGRPKRAIPRKPAPPPPSEKDLERRNDRKQAELAIRVCVSFVII